MSNSTDPKKILSDVLDVFKFYPESLYSLREIQKIVNYTNGNIHKALIDLEQDRFIIRSKVKINDRLVTHWQLNNRNFAHLVDQTFQNFNPSQTNYDTNVSSSPPPQQFFNLCLPPKRLGHPSKHTINSSNGIQCNYSTFDRKSVTELANPRAVDTICLDNHNINSRDNLDKTYIKEFEKLTSILNSKIKPDYNISNKIKNYKSQSKRNENKQKHYQNNSINSSDYRRDDIKYWDGTNKIFMNDKWIVKDDSSESLARTFAEQKQLYNPKQKLKLIEVPMSSVETTTIQFDSTIITNDTEDDSCVKADIQPTSLELPNTPSSLLNNDLMTAMTKNPVSLLHEFAQQNNVNCQIKILEINGPSHKPNIVIGVELNGKSYEPITATNKKEGKRCAAEMVIRQLIADGHFSTERKSTTSKSNNRNSQTNGDLSNRKKSHKKSKTLSTYQRHNSIQELKEHHSQQLPQNQDDLETDVTTISLSDISKPSDTTLHRAQTAPQLTNVSNIPLGIEDSIISMAICVQNKVADIITELSRDAGINLAGRKVVSAMIMENQINETYQVVSLATGNRCITGDKISLNGLVVNDCHAEVIARRALIYFLYLQLKAQINNSEESMQLFEESFSTTDQRGFRIKPHWKFHLYVSTAPCGDSALFSTKENMTDKSKVQFVSRNKHLPIFEHSTQGQLRSKIEGGEGTIPVPVTRDTYQRQTLDGILRGERLKTMSCSDKMARWNYLGLQGALLSQFVEPIFIETVILGNLFNAGHLSRAICCRLLSNTNNNNTTCGSGCTDKINHPNLAAAYIGESSREIDKTNELSINWCLGGKIEVIDGVTGLLSAKIKGQSENSRLCKASLLQEFRQLSFLARPRIEVTKLSYVDSKLMADPYQKRRSAFYQNISSRRLGSWICKPLELTAFNNAVLVNGL